MERKGRRRESQPFADYAGRKSFGTGFDQDPEDLEPGFLGKGAERLDHRFFLHYFF
jgi:hypothetical protein